VEKRKNHLDDRMTKRRGEDIGVPASYSRRFTLSRAPQERILHIHVRVDISEGAEVRGYM
jgi:hypothetical protein